MHHRLPRHRIDQRQRAVAPVEPEPTLVGGTHRRPSHCISSATPKPQAPLSSAAPTHIFGSQWAANAMPLSGNTTSSATRLGNNAPSTTASSRSEEHTSELQSLMRISYAVFC